MECRDLQLKQYACHAKNCGWRINIDVAANSVAGRMSNKAGYPDRARVGRGRGRFADASL